MNDHPCWRDAEAAAGRLTASDRRTLLLLVRLPLIWEAAIERLYGMQGGASVYRCLTRLRTLGFVAEMRPALRARRNPGLLYLTDFGLATVAVDQGVELDMLTRQGRLRGRDLANRLPGLPHLVALYDPLASVAATRTSRIDLLAWEQPWRRAFDRPTRNAPITVELPGRAVLACNDRVESLLLLPDLAMAPPDVHRQALERFLEFRRRAADGVPALVVATTDARRQAWVRLLDAVVQTRREAPLVVRVATWCELRDDASRPELATQSSEPDEDYAGQYLQIPPLVPRLPISRIPRPVGSGLAMDAPRVNRLLALKGMDRDLLDVIGRHPFLSSDSLAIVLGWEVKRLRERLARVIRLGFARLVEPHEVRAPVRTELVELTVDGVELVAAQEGLSVAQAVRFNGLVGGGPENEVGARYMLLRNIEHTVGADAIFVDLYRRLGAATAAGSGDAVVEWRSASACSRRRARPDGYGMIRRHGETYGFFLEFDRGTMSARDYGAKWSGYYHHLERGTFERDYDGFPTILVVTNGNPAEERIARSARAAAVGRSESLPILLTSDWRANLDPSKLDGLLGPIWRNADDATRCGWPPTPHGG